MHLASDGDATEIVLKLKRTVTGKEFWEINVRVEHRKLIRLY